MNAKKGQWINEPRINEWSLHSLRVEGDGEHTLLFTVGEEDTVKIKCDSALSHGFVILHTDKEYVLIKQNETIIHFSDVSTSIPLGALENATFIKQGKTITVLGDNEAKILSITKDAFLQSASFGVAIKGKGDAYIEVF